jgi:hypothetical protein
MTTSKRKTRSSTADDIESTKKIKQENQIILLDLGPLTRAVVLRRPSKTIKSPYVADVIELVENDNHLSFPLLLVEEENEENDEVSPKKKATKKKVDHSVIADKVIEITKTQNNSVQLCHSPSLDCAGMVVAGARVYCSRKKSGSSSKTDLIIQHCEEVREDGSLTLVGYHPALAETLAKELITKNLLVDIVGNFDSIKSQVISTSSSSLLLLLSSSSSSLLSLSLSSLLSSSSSGNIW